MTRRIAGVAALLAVGAATWATGVATAAVTWTLVATPLAVTTGTPTTFTMTATNTLLGQIRCLWVDVPTNFSVSASQVLGSTAGDSWTTSITGNRVRVWTTSGGDELGMTDNVRFTVRATASSTGSLAWEARSFADQSCASAPSLIGVPPVVVVSGPTVTPIAVPTPPPTPVPTVRPTVVPTPRPMPSVTLVPLPLPEETPRVVVPPLPGSSPPPPDRSDAPKGSATPGSGVAPSTAGAVPALGRHVEGAASSAGSHAGSVPEGIRPTVAITGEDGRIELGSDAVDVMAGVEVYAVPAAAIAVPGLVLLIWLALQTIGALAWIPAVRRLRGRDERSA